LLTLTPELENSFSSEIFFTPRLKDKISTELTFSFWGGFQIFTQRLGFILGAKNAHTKDSETVNLLLADVSAARGFSVKTQTVDSKRQIFD